MEGLSYNIEEKSECVKEIKVKVPWEEVERELEGVYKDMRRQVQLPGFRKGKVPVEMIKERFGEESRIEAVERISPRVLKDIVEKESVYPAVAPQIIDYRLEPSKAFELSIRVEVMPEITPKKYKKIKLSKDIQEVKSEDVDKTVKNLKEQNPVLESKEGTAEKGDYAVIEFSVSRDNKKVDLGDGERRFLPLGEEQFLPDFDGNIIGLKKGEEKSFEYIFPPEYEKAELAGVKTEFHVKLIELKSKKLPDEQEIAKNMRMENAGQLREKIEESLKKQLEVSSENKLENEIIEQLIESNDFKVPPGLVKERSEEMLDRMKNYIRQQGGDPSNIDTKQVEKRAEREIKAGVLLGAIADKEGIEITEKDLENNRKEIKNQIGTEDPDEIEKYVNRNAILTGKVFDFIKENARIKEKEVK